MWSPGSRPCTTAVATASPEENEMASCAGFQRRETLLQRTAHRIILAGVAEAARVIAFRAAFERAREVDRQGNGAGGRVDMASGVDSGGFDLHYLPLYRFEAAPPRWNEFPIFCRPPRQFLGEVVFHFRPVARHFVIGVAQYLIGAVAQVFADVLLHARVVQIALAGRLLGDHLQDAIAILVWMMGETAPGCSDITMRRRSGLAFSSVDSGMKPISPPLGAVLASSE